VRLKILVCKGYIPNEISNYSPNSVVMGGGTVGHHDKRTVRTIRKKISLEKRPARKLPVPLFTDIYFNSLESFKGVVHLKKNYC